MNNYTRTPRASRRSKKAGLRRTLLVVCMMLVVMVGSIAGTVAWLTATSGTVTNTFTTGDINIKLDEAVLGATNGSRTEAGNTGYKIIPGAKIAKDPTVTVLEKSEKCYVYALVEDNLLVDGASVATFVVSTNWKAVKTEGNKTLYQYTSIVDASAADQKLDAIFTEVQIADTVIKDKIGQLTNKTVVVNAYAHQSENTDEATADAAAIAWAFPASAN